MATLNLIETLSIVPVIYQPEVIVPTETLSDSLSISPLEHSQYYALPIDDQRAAQSDVTVTVVAKANFAREDSRVGIHVNGILQREFFVSDGHDCLDTPDTGVLTIARSEWEELRELRPGEPALIEMWALFRYPETCPDRYAELSYDYLVEREGGPGPTGSAYCGLVSSHKTLVSGPTEPVGVEHWHHAEWAINRRTGKLIVVSESANAKRTVSGGGVAPADAEGDQISGRPLPGAWESRTTGELAGVAARFKTAGQCVPI